MHFVTDIWLYIRFICTRFLVNDSIAATRAVSALSLCLGFSCRFFLARSQVILQQLQLTLFVIVFLYYLSISHPVLLHLLLLLSESKHCTLHDVIGSR